ncbi:MAG TPA: NgoPII family restriction endonuclease [Methanocorpusculum sp.]|nr:NgoPII family restriction endonuclease [Methanocorpusculum sp.]HJJ57332.1 NgoPII family restriction endonuclease [Methanocorpusculum sp.]
MRNVIDAIISIVTNPVLDLNVIIGKNRANSMGMALEEYIKDIFSGDEPREKVFSYLGNQNNPPDIMIRGGDAIEVKKLESDKFNGSISLNSSYPKDKLYADSPMITQFCRDAEQWTVKDMLYAVGFVKGSQLRALTFVYGEDYAADKSIYEKIRKTIKDGIESIPNVEFTESKELGHVNRVDPLGITYLRIRGMWGIENPFKVFRRHYTPNPKAKFTFMAVMNLTKYHSYQNYMELEELAEKTDNLNLELAAIPNPNNPAILIPAILITFEIL